MRSLLAFTLRHPVDAARLYRWAYEREQFEELLATIDDRILQSRSMSARADLARLQARAEALSDDIG